MTTYAPLSGVMRCWYAAHISVGGKSYIALQGMNWRGEYDRARLQENNVGPWWHVPASRLYYDPQHDIPLFQVMKQRILKTMRSDWPLLQHGTVVKFDQDFFGLWGYTSPNGKRDVVVCVAIDLGNWEKLPPLIHRPGQKSPLPPRPTTWIQARNIEQLGRSEAYPLFTLSVAHVVPFPTQQGTYSALVTDIALQAPMGQIFREAFGNLFPRLRHRAPYHPRLRLSSRYVPKPDI